MIMHSNRDVDAWFAQLEHLLKPVMQKGPPAVATTRTSRSSYSLTGGVSKFDARCSAKRATGQMVEGD